MSQNIPIDVNASFNTAGEIKPCWIRLEIEDHSLQVLKIEKIYTKEKSNFAGFHVVTFQCMIVINNKEEFIKISYMIDSQKWYLQKI